MGPLSLRWNSSCTDSCRKRLIEILNTGGFQPPMIVFVNQKKGADVLMKDLARARVRHAPSCARLTRFAVERHDAAFGQEPGATRSGAQLDQVGRVRRARRDRSRRSRYRCSRRFARDQLSDGKHYRGVCASYRYVSCTCLDWAEAATGRTGRAGKTGVAITFLSDGDEELMYVDGISVVRADQTW